MNGAQHKKENLHKRLGGIFLIFFNTFLNDNLKVARPCCNIKKLDTPTLKFMMPNDNKICNL